METKALGSSILHFQAMYDKGCLILSLVGIPSNIPEGSPTFQQLLTLSSDFHSTVPSISQSLPISRDDDNFRQEITCFVKRTVSSIKNGNTYVKIETQ